MAPMFDQTGPHYPDHVALVTARQYLARVGSGVPYITTDSNGTPYCTGCGRPIDQHRSGYPCRRYL